MLDDNTLTPSEILINATLVTKDKTIKTYEFILNADLVAIQAVSVESMIEGIVFPIHDYKNALHKTLFELNHVRVNPSLDNRLVIQRLTEALTDVGLKVSKVPSTNDLAMCYRPLGELSDNVRFYLEGDGHVIFLSPHGTLRVVSNKPALQIVKR